MAVDYTQLSGSKTPKEPWKPLKPISVTQNAMPGWSYGQGVSDGGHSSRTKHVEIDPFAPGRPMLYNYSLLISGIVPRPIGLLSTLSAEGKPNLAPFSYFQVVDHDPPVFVIGFSGRRDRPKDTLRNLEETGEVCINIVSENMVEAVNATSVDAPYGISEWDISGLKQAPTTTVRPARVQESKFAIEGKLIQTVEYATSKSSVGAHGKLAIIEATRFWVAGDAIDENYKHIDLEKLRPVGQLGGISYARISETFELARRTWKSMSESFSLEKKGGK